MFLDILHPDMEERPIRRNQGQLGLHTRLLLPCAAYLELWDGGLGGVKYGLEPKRWCP